MPSAFWILTAMYALTSVSVVPFSGVITVSAVTGCAVRMFGQVTVTNTWRLGELTRAPPSHADTPVPVGSH